MPFERRPKCLRTQFDSYSRNSYYAIQILGVSAVHPFRIQFIFHFMASDQLRRGNVASPKTLAQRSTAGYLHCLTTLELEEASVRTGRVTWGL